MNTRGRKKVARITETTLFQAIQIFYLKLKTLVCVVSGTLSMIGYQIKSISVIGHHRY